METEGRERNQDEFVGCGVCGADIDDVHEILTGTCEHCATHVEDDRVF